MKLLLPLLFSNILLQASYVKMLDYYDKEKYVQVIAEAKKSYSEYSNPELHLLWAKSAEKLGLTTEAMGAYERVIILDENNSDAQSALGTIYKNTNREELPVNPYAPQNNGKWKIKTDLSLGHDSNVNANPGGTALDEYYGVVGNTGTVSSNFMRFTGDIAYIQKLEEAEGWFVKSTLNLYSQSNFSAHKYDLTVGTAALGAGYNSTNYSFYLPLSYDYIHYLDKNLMERYRFMPSLYIPLSAQALLNISANYTRRSYRDQEDKKNDAYTLGAGMGLYYSMDNSSAYLNIKYEERTAEETFSSQYIDANFITVDAHIKHSFRDTLFAEVAYTFRYGDYKDNIGTLLIPSKTIREDYFNQLDIKLTQVLTKNIELYLRNTYADNRSNYMPTEYDKNVFMFGISVIY